jgi:hypothetical protein
MTENSLRPVLGLALVASHVVVIFCAVGIQFDGAILFDQLVQTIAVVSPILALHTSAVVKYFIDNPGAKRGRGPALGDAFVALSFMFPGLYALSVLLLLWTFGYTRKLDFTQFVTLLGVAEATFAVYSAKIVASLYGGVPSPHSKGPTAEESVQHPSTDEPTR